MPQYFQMSEGRYCLNGEVRSRVQLRQGNLVDPLCLKDQPPYNIIFCRNLLVYLHRAARDRAIETLDRLLVPNGLLFVGYADTGPIDLQRFVSVAVPHLAD